MIKAIFVYAPFAMFALLMATYVVMATEGVRHRARLQAVIGMLLLLCCSKFLCFRAFGGDAFAPTLPDWLIWVWDWAYSGACILAALTVMSIICRLKRRWARTRAVAFPVLAWGLSAWGVWNGIRPPEIRQLTLEYENLPPALDGYRIVQLSDIHVSSSLRRWRTEAIVGMVNRLDADLVCLTGDYADGYPRDLRRDLEPIAGLKSRDGVYAVTGNHEYYYPWNEWSYWFARWGIEILSDRVVTPRDGLTIVGIDDRAKYDRGFAPQPPLKVQDLLARAEGAPFTLFLMHRPVYAGIASRAGANLQLSGHTHGGIMPVLRLIIGSFNGWRTRGLYEEGPRSWLYVSPGCGQWAGFPIRFFNPSEITHITLRRK